MLNIVQSSRDILKVRARESEEVNMQQEEERHINA